MSKEISPLARTIHDGALQCPLYYPDCQKVPKPHFEKKRNLSFSEDFDISLYNSDQHNLLIATQKKKNVRKNRINLELSSPIDIRRGTDAGHFTKPPKRIPDPEQTGLVLIVSDYDHKPLSSSQAETIMNSVGVNSF